MGKTAIAIQYTYRHRADYDVARWILGRSARSGARIADGVGLETGRIDTKFENL
jgi:hypothetical protein